ncbi:putative Yip interacting protein [Giardia muris]|uniref:Putative Yip interacting protein n=1 Tax=Giardia muris TaxID=5742 RepID=A0A4Z1T1V5_GIAMU|nr:putative Yip interacting protein [Giardia muris]|eukprot:TNJ26957.1 putative Yip interacting protein [Giardia muris]
MEFLKLGRYAGLATGKPFDNGAMTRTYQVIGENGNMLLRNLSPYFDLTSMAFLTRLGLLLFPYVSFERRSQGLPLDLYTALVGHGVYGMAVALRSILSTQGFTTLRFTWHVTIAAIIIGLELVVVVLVGGSVGLPLPKLETLSLICYKVFFAGVVILLSMLGRIAYALSMAFVGMGLAVHLGMYGTQYIQEAKSRLCLSPRQLTVQTWLIATWALLQPAILLVLTF